MFAHVPDPNLQEIGMEQVSQLLTPSLAVQMYYKKGLRMRDFIYTRFCAEQSSVALINRASLRTLF